MKIKTSELIGPALDWAVAKCEGRSLRDAVCATHADVENLEVPFTMYEVVCTYRDDACVAAEVKPIVVTRYGVMKEYGATAPSITFVGSDGRKAIGSVDMFFSSEVEARVEANIYINGNMDGYSPSTDWAQGGPIIERERICIYYEERLAPVNTWRGYLNFIHDSVGPTPLIAAMRCVVAVHLGDEVEIPEELNVCDALIKSVSTKLAKR